MTFLEIVAEIGSQVKAYPNSELYVGITSDIESRVHGDHKVPKKDGWFISSSADSNKIARDVEKFFLNKGMEGGIGGGDYSSKYVYVYHITSSTKP